MRLRLAVLAAVLFLFTSAGSAQTLSAAQNAALKTAIQNDSGANAFFVVGDLSGLAAYENQPATPDFWIWRTSVSRADVYNTVDWEAGVWNWTTYKNQQVTEQNAWTQIFMGDQADFSQDNVRAGITSIFTGSAPAVAQQNHCLSVGRRKATRFEKVFATGTGSTASPSKPGVDAAGVAISGAVSYTLFVGL